MNTAEQVLYLLKTHGPTTVQQMAVLLELTTMGARRHLETWQEKGVVAFEETAEKVGRPTRRWMLTEAGQGRFPDRHAELTVQLIEEVRSLFGEDAVDRLIAKRETASEAHYRTLAAAARDTPMRVAVLAMARTAEGYMAQVEEQADGSLLLIENHCPICSAARSCQQFCRSELAIFQRVLGEACSVTRSEHALSGERRCVYVIKPIA